MDVYSDPTPIATVEQFKTALKAVRDGIGISQKEVAMLKFHCRAPAHTVTAQQLAKEFNYRHYVAAAGQYGTLAHHVCDALHYVLPPTPSGEPHWWRTLAYGNDGVPVTDDGHYEWIMRPQLVQALQEWKWA
jgi:hypothetical protein